MRAAKLRFKRERDRRTVQRASSGDSMCTERQLLNAKKVISYLKRYIFYLIGYLFDCK